MTTAIKSKGEMLRQVRLRRPTAIGYSEDVFWIDNALAKVGKRVRDENGLIWKIEEIYNAKTFTDVDVLRAAWKQFSDVLDGH